MRGQQKVTRPKPQRLQKRRTMRVVEAPLLVSRRGQRACDLIFQPGPPPQVVGYLVPQRRYRPTRCRERFLKSLLVPELGA